MNYMQRTQTETNKISDLKTPVLSLRLLRLQLYLLSCHPCLYISFNWTLCTTSDSLVQRWKKGQTIFSITGTCEVSSRRGTTSVRRSSICPSLPQTKKRPRRTNSITARNTVVLERDVDVRNRFLEVP